MTANTTPQVLVGIGEAARRVGVRVSAVRFYEAQGLVQPAERRGAQRRYDQEAIERLAIVGLLKSAGFSLTQIAGLFTTGGPDDSSWQVVAAQKAEELDTRITKLQRMRDYLEVAQSCPSPGLLECPHLRAAIRQKP